ncbi:gamma subclass chorismate mutase AroQ [Nocardia macrotermitis]|uniref:chorismate mutase n=1 Tax=Nocardia macrotermitis TaxID=2585198 RepID=A0A7K0D963_9NOCA|nr:gamma subclass chorismate mutase AroQ [Nocardia macrotermitis]MQY22323.1 Secreted chorismate mutase [Nocardia macrotermitis]
MRRSVVMVAAAAAIGVMAVEVVPMTIDPVVAAAQSPSEKSPASDAASPDPLIGLLLERLNTADAVIAAKWVSARGQYPVIDDPAREQVVYDSMSRAGTALGLPESWVRQVFAGQIEANKMVQRGLLARWRLDPGSAPRTSPDLTAVRPIIDRVNLQILRQLAQRRTELRAPDCAIRLSTGVFGVFGSGRSDALHETALVRAAASVCG